MILYGDITSYLPMNLLIDTWVVSKFWLLGIIHWTFVWTFLCGHMFSILLDISIWLKHWFIKLLFKQFVFTLLLWRGYPYEILDPRYKINTPLESLAVEALQCCGLSCFLNTVCHIQVLSSQSCFYLPVQFSADMPGKLCAQKGGPGSWLHAGPTLSVVDMWGMSH